MTTRTVGPSGTFSTIQAAVAAAVSGDTISADPAGNPYILSQDNTPALAAITVTKNLSFVSSVPGTHVKCSSNGWVSNDKGYFVIRATVSFDWFEFINVTSYIANITAIRYESGNLAMTNCWSHGYLGNGLLLTPLVDDGSTGIITIDRCEFDHLGAGDGLTHLAYIGRVAQLTVTNSFFHDINPGGGNLFKTRAKVTTVTNNRIYANNSDAIWEMDFSNGGTVNVSNNVIQQGANDPNTNVVSMGPERDANPPNWPGSSANFQGNTIVNDLDGGALYFNPFNIPTTWNNTRIWASNSFALPQGMTNNTILTSRPVLDNSHPWAGSVTPPTPAVYTAGIAETATLVDHPAGISASNQVTLVDHLTAVDAWTSRAVFGSSVAESRLLQEAMVSGGTLLTASLTEAAGTPVDALSYVYTPAVPPTPGPPPVPPPIPIPPVPPSGSPDGTPPLRSVAALAENRSVEVPDPGSRHVFSLRRS